MSGARTEVGYGILFGPEHQRSLSLEGGRLRGQRLLRPSGFHRTWLCWRDEESWGAFVADALGYMPEDLSVAELKQFARLSGCTVGTRSHEVDGSFTGGSGTRSSSSMNTASAQIAAGRSARARRAEAGASNASWSQSTRATARSRTVVPGRRRRSRESDGFSSRSVRSTARLCSCLLSRGPSMPCAPPWRRIRRRRRQGEGPTGAADASGARHRCDGSDGGAGTIGWVRRRRWRSATGARSAAQRGTRPREGVPSTAASR